MKGVEKAKELGATAKAKASGLLDIIVKTITKNPLKSAIVATCVYALIPLGLWLDYLLTSEKALGLNEWGDFLAGAFGPIAFMWLVIGYLQQGNELRQSAIALKLQAEELRKSVEQQKEMVNLTWQQVDPNGYEDRQRVMNYLQGDLPYIKIEGIELIDITRITGESSFVFSLVNYGAVAKEVHVVFEENSELINSVDLPLLEKGQPEQFHHAVTGPTLPVRISLRVEFTDPRGRRRFTAYSGILSEHPDESSFDDHLELTIIARNEPVTA